MKKLITSLLLCMLATAAAAQEVVRYQADRSGLHRCVVRVQCGNAAGTGTIVETNGYDVVITAAHVVSGGDAVTLWDGTRRINGEVIGRDKANDVAVIAARNLDMLDVIAAPLLDRRARQGETVQHCGYARGRLESTKGVVLAANDSRARCTGEAISGDSGSPFFIDGKVAGIVTNKTTYSVPVSTGLFGRVRYSQPEPAFIGTASLIITAIIYAKPIIMKIIELYKAWRAFRNRVIPTSPCLPCRPKKDEAPTPPPAPEPAPTPMPPPVGSPPPPVVEASGISPWWIAAGPGCMGVAILTFFAACIVGMKPKAVKG